MRKSLDSVTHTKTGLFCWILDQTGEFQVKLDYKKNPKPTKHKPPPNPKQTNKTNGKNDFISDLSKYGVCSYSLRKSLGFKH